MSAGKKRVCLDVGGTFTDCLVMDASGDLNSFKSATTPKDPTDGLLDTLIKAAAFCQQDVKDFLGDVDLLVHGTTLATNTLLTGGGAKTAMLTTRDFRDILELRRGIKPLDISLFNLFIAPNRPLIPRSRRIGVEERTLYTGEISVPLNEAEVAKAVAGFKKSGVEAIAVCFLHSYANGTNERRAADICKDVAPDIYVTTSHETIPVWREFERFNTTAVGAYVGPAVARYLVGLETRLKDNGFSGTFLMMLANGLVQRVDRCVDRGVYLLNSGPAAAPAAAAYLGKLLGKKNLVAVDMGGTSFEVCLIHDGEIMTTTESWVGDQRIAIKMVDLETAGAGGGSIASIDSLGLLKVGPESAAADPGPACYGKGTDPTVTDADLVLGYIPDDYFLGGEMKLDVGHAEKSMDSIGKKLGLNKAKASQAVFDSINATMADEITAISTKRGHDIRDFVLVAGGGGGPIHAGFLADHLDIPTVVIPPVAALFSAFGMFAMDLGQDFARSYIARANGADIRAIAKLYKEMEAEAFESFAVHGIAKKDITLQRTADMRYIGQFSEVETEIDNGTFNKKTLRAGVEAFGKKHEALYTFSMPWKGVEVLTLRLKASVDKAPFHLPRIKKGKANPSTALKRTRMAWFQGKKVKAPVYDGDLVRAGNKIPGPAIIEESTTTVVIPESYTCRVDGHKNYVLTRN
jgi:N-methylhydantoinase A